MMWKSEWSQILKEWHICHIPWNQKIIWGGEGGRAGLEVEWATASNVFTYSDENFAVFQCAIVVKVFKLQDISLNAQP